jgi:hypothetical protein
MTATDDAKTPGQPAETRFEELVYRQDLNEVYLLLDFISGRPDKRLSDLDHKISDPHSNTKDRMSPAEIIARVSEMRYPPDRPAREKAADAAFLLELKDCLNSMAYPARGLTIAYTTMFTEGGHGLGHAIRNSLARIFGRRRSGSLSPGETATPTRVQMAHLAFPGLVPIAGHFRHMKRLVSLAGIFITLISAFFLWQATYGVRLAVHFAQTKRVETEMISRLFGQLDKEGRSTQVANQPGGLDDFCTFGKTSGDRVASAGDPGISVTDANGITPVTR